MRADEDHRFALSLTSGEKIADRILFTIAPVFVAPFGKATACKKIGTSKERTIEPGVRGADLTELGEALDGTVAGVQT